MDPLTPWKNRVRTALLALALATSSAAARAGDLEQSYELWLIDQSNSPGKTYGGKISIYAGEDISGRSASKAPVPLSGDPHASTGSTPGIGVIQVTAGGSDGFVKAIVRISNTDAAVVERADAHGIALRIVR